MTISDPVQLAVVTGVFTVIGIWLKRGQNKLHTLVNSRMTELLELTRKSAKAEGVKEGENKA